MTNGNRNFTSTAPRWLILFAWFCLISSFSLASPVPACPTDCECSRNRDGLQKATCTDLQWDEIAYPNIHILVLKPSDVDAECNIPDDISLLFPQLNFISLRNCSLAYISSNSFYDLKQLQEVDLSHNSIRKFNHSSFAANTKLRYVNLENNRLDLSSHPLPSSGSLWELNLASCDLDRLPSNAFEGLPNLRYLSLADNRLETIGENYLPSGLKRLDLSGNRIVNVPLPELNRLKGLKEIDVSRNPINCTCQLMGFQDWVSGKGTIFRNQIRCVLPAKYAGYSLANVPQYQLCDIKVQRDQQLISNDVGLTDGYVMDEQFSEPGDDDDFLFDVKLDRVVGKESKHHHSRRSSSPLENKPKGSDGTVVEGSGDEGMDIDGSGDDSTDESKIFAKTSPQKNESSTVARLSATPVDSKKAPSSTISVDSNVFKSSDKYTAEEESTPPPSLSTLTADEESGESTTVYNVDASGSNSSKPPSPSSDATIRRKQPEVTELPNGTGEVTKISAIAVPRDSVNSGSSISPEGSTENSNSASSAPTASAKVASSEGAEGLVGEMSPSGGITRETIAASTAEPEENEAETEHTPPVSQTEVDREKEAHVNKLGPPELMPNEAGLPAATSTLGDDKAEETTDARSSDKREGATRSTAEPIPGQAAKNENVKSATGTPYIVPSLLIVAVALVCFSIYFSQHNCRPQRWNQSDPKVNNPTELQDVSLLAQRNSNSHSNKYETEEGKSPQTERLMNGNEGGGGDYADENNGRLPASKSLAHENLPPVKKSTTRVTTNYESLPRTPTIIHKS